MDKVKTCSKCKETKPVSEFSKCCSKKDGLRSACKSCIAKYSAKYRAENKDKIRARDAKYRAENKDKIRDRHAKYAYENKDKIRARIARWRAKNRDKTRDISARWRAKNRDKALAYSLNWTKENPHARRNLVKSLSDGYVRHLFTGHEPHLKASDIPQELVELKRVQLKIMRKLKESK